MSEKRYDFLPDEMNAVIENFQKNIQPNIPYVHWDDVTLASVYLPNDLSESCLEDQFNAWASNGLHRGVCKMISLQYSPYNGCLVIWPDKDQHESYIEPTAGDKWGEFDYDDWDAVSKATWELWQALVAFANDTKK